MFMYVLFHSLLNFSILFQNLVPVWILEKWRKDGDGDVVLHHRYNYILFGHNEIPCSHFHLISFNFQQYNQAFAGWGLLGSSLICFETFFLCFVNSVYVVANILACYCEISSEMNMKGLVGNWSSVTYNMVSLSLIKISKSSFFFEALFFSVRHYAWIPNMIWRWYVVHLFMAGIE